MKTILSKIAKNAFEKDFFKLIKDVVFGKTMENVKNIEILNLSQQNKEETIRVTTKLSYYKVFPKKSIGNRTEKKTEILMNKPIYLGLSVLELSKILMYEFWYDYVKPKYDGKAKFCFIVYIKTDDIRK